MNIASTNTQIIKLDDEQSTSASKTRNEMHEAMPDTPNSRRPRRSSDKKRERQQARQTACVITKIRNEMHCQQIDSPQRDNRRRNSAASESDVTTLTALAQTIRMSKNDSKTTQNTRRAQSEDPSEIRHGELSLRKTRHFSLQRQHDPLHTVFGDGRRIKQPRTLSVNPKSISIITVSDTVKRDVICIDDDDSATKASENRNTREGRTVRRIRKTFPPRFQHKRHSSDVQVVNAPTSYTLKDSPASSVTQAQYSKLMEEGSGAIAGEDVARADNGDDERITRRRHLDRDGTLELGQKRPVRSMPLPSSGAFRPVNRLAEPTNSSIGKPNSGKQHNSSSISGYSSFDPPPPKRQRVEFNRTEANEVIDLIDAQSISTHDSRRFSLTLSNAERRPINLSNDESIHPVLGRGSSFKAMEKLLKPTRSRDRQRSSGSATDLAQPHTGKRQVKGHSTQDAIRDLEDQGDLISEDELTAIDESGKSRAKPFVEITVRKDGMGYQGSANLRAPRQGAIKRHSSEHRFKNGSKSPYFHPSVGEEEGLPPKGIMSQFSKSKVDLKKEHNDTSYDEISADHYQRGEDEAMRPNPHTSIVNHESKATIDPVPTATTSPTYRTIDDSSSAEEDRREAGAQIKPTNFSNSSRTKLLKGQKRFDLFKIFSEQCLWLVENSDARWSLVYDLTLKNLTIYGAEANFVFEFNASSVLRLEYDEDSSKVVIHRARDSTTIGDCIYLELGSDEQRQELKDLLRKHVTLSVHPKPDGHLQKVFTNKISKIQNFLNGKKVKEVAPDIMLIQTNAQRKVNDKFDKAQAQKQGLRTLKPKHDLKEPVQINDDQSIVRSMRGFDNTVQAHAGQKQKSRPQGVDPNGFYGTIDHSDRNFSSAPSTRTSDRVSTRRAVRSPTPPEPEPDRWTDKNPNWRDLWKASLTYPQDGPKKTIVDQQDIQRLDEGEYLNDNLICFYLRWLENNLQESNPDLAKRIYFQNSFFYERLVKDPPKGQRINHESVRRWTTKVDLLKYDYIIFPVNENSHWYVAIVCNAKGLIPSPSTDLAKEESTADLDEAELSEGEPLMRASPTAVLTTSSDIEKTKAYSSDSLQTKTTTTTVECKPRELSNGTNFDENPTSSDQDPSELKRSASKAQEKRKSVPAQRNVDMSAPRVILLDSLGLRHSPTATNLRAYFVAEIKDKTGIEINDKPKLGLTAKHLPQQTNYCDCGLFLLMYVEMFLTKGDDFIHGLLQGTEDLDLEWGTASQLREKIRDLLMTLQRAQIVHHKKLRAKKNAEKAKFAGDTALTNKSARPAEPLNIHLASKEIGAKVEGESPERENTKNFSENILAKNEVSLTKTNIDVIEIGVNAGAPLSVRKSASPQNPEPIVIDESQDAAGTSELCPQPLPVQPSKIKTSSTLRHSSTSYETKIRLSHEGDSHDVDGQSVSNTPPPKSTLNDQRVSASKVRNQKHIEHPAPNVVEILDSPEQARNKDRLVFGPSLGPSPQFKSSPNTLRSGLEAVEQDSNSDEFSAVDIVYAQRFPPKHPDQEASDVKMLFRNEEVDGDHGRPIALPNSSPASSRKRNVQTARSESAQYQPTSPVTRSSPRRVRVNALSPTAKSPRRMPAVVSPASRPPKRKSDDDEGGSLVNRPSKNARLDPSDEKIIGKKGKLPQPLISDRKHIKFSSSQEEPK